MGTAYSVGLNVFHSEEKENVLSSQCRGGDIETARGSSGHQRVT